MKIHCFRAAAAVAAVVILASPATGQKRKDLPHGHLAPILEVDQKKADRTQQLSVPRRPPLVQTGNTRQLTFHVAPLTPSGILSKQVRDSLRALFKKTRKDRIVHLRAFVAGSGDTRRVADVVGEVFSERKTPLPSLSVVQIGKLPLPTADVAIEAVAESRNTVNEHGLAFISGQTVASGEAVLEVAALAKASLDKIRSAATGLGLKPQSDVLRVTCYCSSLSDGPAVRREMESAFPKAALNHLQLRRVYTRASVSCEAVARLAEAAGNDLQFENPERLLRPEEYSQAALVSSGRLVFSGTQIAFQHRDSDIRLAFERLEESLDESGASYRDVAFSRFYTLSAGISERIRQLRFSFFEKGAPPATTMIELEGLPSLDASFAMDVIAVAR